MAITTPTIVGPGLMPVVRSAPWAYNDDQEDDASGGVELVAAPSAGSALYLTHVTMSGQAADVAITLLNGATVIFGPIQMQDAGGGLLTKDWKHPLKLTDATALNVKSGTNMDFTIYVEGFTGQTPIT